MIKNILFMGTPDFAVESLKALVSEGYELTVVTQQDKPKGRGYTLMPTPVKAFAAENGLRKLSFGSEEELWRYLALRPGSVSPLGLLSGSAGDVRFFLDSDLRGSLIGAHPCDNTATVYMTDSDLFSLLRGADVEYGYADIPERN